MGIYSFTPRSLYHQEKSPGTHWVGGWVGPRAGQDYGEEKNLLPLPGMVPLPITILTELSQQPIPNGTVHSKFVFVDVIRVPVNFADHADILEYSFRHTWTTVHGRWTALMKKMY
jgi:hypothetical protein